MLICKYCGKETKSGNDLIIEDKKVKKCCGLAIFGIEDIKEVENEREKRKLCNTA